jgi:hypothetical protein
MKQKFEFEKIEVAPGVFDMFLVVAPNSLINADCVSEVQLDKEHHSCTFVYKHGSSVTFGGQYAELAKQRWDAWQEFENESKTVQVPAAVMRQIKIHTI